jgi:hypothetical protein
VCFNPLHKPCFWTGAKLDKKSAFRLRDSSAHSLLWIFIGLSTEGVGFLLAAAFLRRGHVTQGRQAAWSTPLCEQKYRRDRSRKIFLHSDGLDDGFQEAVNAAAANVVGT